jgi:hypothetical protein
MPQLILLLALIGGLWYWWSAVKGLSPEERRSFLWRSAFWAVLGLSIMLVGSGRMHWIGAGIAALIPLTKTAFRLGLRALPFLSLLSRFKSSPSQFRTKSLLVTVNFATKQMSGEVLAGEYTGKTLSELTPDELNTLAADLRANDRESFVLLNAYRMRGGDGTQESSDDYQPRGASDLSNEECYKILGLNVNASKEEVLKAHKRLIQRLHPDRGGSDYLAAKINAAKDKLS